MWCYCKFYLRVTQLCENAKLDEYIVVSNHFHGTIILLEDKIRVTNRTRLAASLQAKRLGCLFFIKK